MPTLFAQPKPSLHDWVTARRTPCAFQRLSSSTPFRNPDGSRKHMRLREKEYPDPVIKDGALEYPSGARYVIHKDGSYGRIN